jgi:hypothetical protein
MLVLAQQSPTFYFKFMSLIELLSQQANVYEEKIKAC